jgi:hypothetical protein
MAQFLRPDSDVTTTNWTRSTGTNSYFTYIDEVVADSTDYVQTQIQAANFEVGLSNPTTPLNAGNHIVRVRAWSLGSGAAERHTVLLLQGTTTIATPVNNATLTRTTPTTTTYTLTSGEVAAITDYTNLRLRFSAGTLAAGETYRVGWAELEVPNATTTRYILIT